MRRERQVCWLDPGGSHLRVYKKKLGAIFYPFCKQINYLRCSAHRRQVDLSDAIKGSQGYDKTKGLLGVLAISYIRDVVYFETFLFS